MGLGLGIIFDGDALGARKGADNQIHLVVLHQLFYRLDGAIRAGVRGHGDEFDLFPAHGVIVLLQGQFDATHAVLAQGGECALQGCQASDLDYVLGLGDAAKTETQGNCQTDNGKF